MENDIKFNNLIKNLRKQSPQLHEGDELTASILSKIDRSNSAKRISILPWIRACSGIAAIFLIGLFIFQHNESEKGIEKSSSGTLISFQMNSSCPESVNKHSSLLEMYACHLAENHLKNKQIESYFHQSNN